MRTKSTAGTDESAIDLSMATGAAAVFDNPVMILSHPAQRMMAQAAAAKKTSDRSTYSSGSVVKNSG